MHFSWSLTATVLAWASAQAVTISEINGDSFLSPHKGQKWTKITGLVTAKGPSGIWIRSTSPDKDYRTSESIYVYNSTFGSSIDVGSVINLNATVSDYRSSDTYLYLTELTSPILNSIVSTGNTVTPLVIGVDTLSPPTEAFTSLDKGDVYGVPNNASMVSTTDPVLQPQLYGLDFWQSLTGELVTVKGAQAITRADTYGNTWVVGNWNVTGLNARGGLTMTDGDSNPEAVIIGSPLDGSDNPSTTKVGDSLDDITGIVTYAYGYYSILPLTALTVTGSAKPANPPATTLVSTGTCKGITVGDYNVENLGPTVAHLPGIADHIVNYLKSPDLIFVQEIQDDSGPTDDGVVDANVTLTTLVKNITAIGGLTYEYVDIDPVNDQDGGEPGGNIRQAYLYNPDVIKLRNPNPGSSTTANVVLPGPELKYNPGRIDPQNTTTWKASRKPLAAAWETLDGKNKFFTINVHFESKGGGSPIEGDARPPVNGGIENRYAQMEDTANFVAEILAIDGDAKVLVAGDFNEFTFVSPVEHFAAVSGLQNLNDAAGIPKVEQYTYLYDMNCQEIDQMYVSQALAVDAQLEHIHVNTWATLAGMVSDHDPTVAKLNVCSS